MDDRRGPVEYVDVTGRRIAYEVIGQGPLVVLSTGMADTRAAYRFLAPLIADAGYRAASVDLRAHGESSTGWNSYSHADTAGDLMAVVRKLGGPAVIVGQSFSGGAATIAAAAEPDLVRGIVEIGPFTRPPKFSIGALMRNHHNYRRGTLLLGRVVLTGSVQTWSKYLDVAYPGHKPPDWDTSLTALQANLHEPGRMSAARKMMNSKPSRASLKDAAAKLGTVRCPALVIVGSDDPDFPDPEAEAVAIVDLLPAGLGKYMVIDGAGHYPHAQFPQQVADAVLPFLAERAFS